MTVLVGQSEVNFVLHKKIVCEKSKFFRAMHENNWKEATEGIVRLPEVSKEEFGIYVGWLYTGIIDMTDDDDLSSKTTYNPDMRGNERRKLYKRIVDAYALGDMLRDASFRNALCSEVITLQQLVGTGPACAENVAHLFNKTPYTAKMARMFADYKLSATYDVKSFSETHTNYPPELFKVMALVVVEEQDKSPSERSPALRPKCYYHDHEEDSDKCA